MELFPAAVFNPQQASRNHAAHDAGAGNTADGGTATGGAATGGANGRAASARRIERLPFTIRRVETEADLLKAVRVRHAAYARHVPDFARTLTQPEAADYEDDSIVLLAESKLDGTPIGSTRLSTNARRPLSVEESIVLPDWLQGKRLVEATRLGIDEGRVGRMVKIALVKACFMYCEEHGIDYSVAAGRVPVDRQYQQLMFVDVFPELGMVPLRHAGNIPHRVMAFEIATFKQRWLEARHPMLDFFFNTHHPDIDIGRAAANLPQAQPQAQLPSQLSPQLPPQSQPQAQPAAPERCIMAFA